METVAILELSRNLHYHLWIICRWFKAISITITNKRKEKPKKQTLIDQTYWLVRWRFISATSVIRVIGPLCNYAKGLPIINSKEATTNSIHIHELSLLFSYLKTAKTDDRWERVSVRLTSRMGRDLSSYLFTYKALGGAPDKNKWSDKVTPLLLFFLNSATVSINRLLDSKLSSWCLGALFECSISRDKPFHPLTPQIDLRQYAVSYP